MFDFDEGRNDIPGYNSKSDSEVELPIPLDLFMTQLTTLQWKDEADAKLCGSLRAGFQSSKERQLCNAHEF